MRPQLIVDCGGRVLSALLVTAGGELVPCSQEIRNVATRHVSSDILLEPRVVEDRDFVWEDALETIAKAGPNAFFQRARRIGLRRPWDAQASAEALQITSPLSVLSSPAALADRVAGAALPRVGLVLLDALLDPTFAFLRERELAPRDVDAIIVLPAQAGRHTRLVMQKLFRRRDFRKVVIVRRELAAAMALTPGAPCACVVVEASETDLHLHRVVLDGGSDSRQLRTAASVTLTGFGWNYWSARIAKALHMTPCAAFERALTTLLTGSPDSLPTRITHGAVQSVLNEHWSATHDMSERLREPLASIEGEELPLLFTGEIFTLDAVRRAFGSYDVDAPVVDQGLRNVALAMRARFVLEPSGSLRINTFRGEALELLSHAQLPASGEACHVERDFRVAGDAATGHAFLIHLLWGADRAPEGNATLCALRIELRGSEPLRLTVNLRRSRTGRHLRGTVEARTPAGMVARARFAEELEVTK
ncbi:MAG TPA: hypothetical protein VEK79_14065 [Thermoanaerobaculia bacterium]|nr:hypothetical protein [Thermoanaerobaculia bacterium]